MDKNGNIKSDDMYLKIQPIERVNDSYTSLELLLNSEIKYLPESALLMVYDYHNSWNTDLIRGEVPMTFMGIYSIVKDIERTESVKRKQSNLKHKK